MEPSQHAQTSYGRRLSDLAALHPATPAITIVGDSDVSITWQDLDRKSNQVARVMLEAGCSRRDIVGIALANSISHYVTQFAAWKIGACALPLPPGIQPWEQDRILRLRQPGFLVGGWESGTAVSADELMEAAAQQPDSPLRDATASPARAILSGGSTGLPKLIVLRQPGVVDARPVENESTSYVRGDEVGLIMGPLYHSAPFTVGHTWLFKGCSLVVMARFEAQSAISAFERQHANLMLAVPTMLHRMARLPGIDSVDFRSLNTLVVGASACPDWLVRRWLDLIGPEKFLLAYGAAERQGFTDIRGDDWLSHPGSVGQGRGADVRIVDQTGQPAAPGTVGEVYLRPRPPEPTYDYVGADRLPVTADGFVATGDMGSLDADGYLYLADRKKDLIKSGGVSVYPAEVESALMEHPDVLDVAVIGLPDPEWGQRVHAVVLVRPGGTLSAADLIAFSRTRVSAAKVPKSVELVEDFPRTESGKVNRSALLRERAGGGLPDVGRPPEREAEQSDKRR